MKVGTARLFKRSMQRGPSVPRHRPIPETRSTRRQRILTRSGRHFISVLPYRVWRILLVICEVHNSVRSPSLLLFIATRSNCRLTACPALGNRLLDAFRRSGHSASEVYQNFGNVSLLHRQARRELTGSIPPPPADFHAGIAITTYSALLEVARTYHLQSSAVEDMVHIPDMLQGIYPTHAGQSRANSGTDRVTVGGSAADVDGETEDVFVRRWTRIAEDMPAARAALACSQEALSCTMPAS